jgi:hypothetical protein
MINALLVTALPQSRHRCCCTTKMQGVAIATPFSRFNIQPMLSTYKHPLRATLQAYRSRLSRPQIQLENHTLSVSNDTQIST